MTDIEQQIAIAKFCGWKFCMSADGSGEFWHDSSGKIKSDGIIPDYLNDLNAMYEAEKLLNCYQQMNYVKWFQDAAERSFNITTNGLLYFLHIHTTAAQRAEALLKTIHKWKD